MQNYDDLPSDLPAPTDDGAADHLPGMTVPTVTLPSTAGESEGLRLPTFEADGQRLYKRLTLVVDDGRVTHVFYPIFPPDQHAAQVLDWLRANPRA